MSSQQEIFESLLGELQREIRLEPRARNKDHENLTLQHFLEHGRKTEDHDLWRECHMLEEMVAIANRRFLALNPQKKRELELKEILENKETTASSIEFRLLYEYEQDIDSCGRSQQEIDGTTTRYPSISRVELETLAAENYLFTTWGITKKQATTKPNRPDITAGSKRQNANPVLSWEEFAEELKKDFHSDTTIRKAAQRTIDDYHGKQQDPWPMGGCAAEYQIVDPKTKRNREHPTPASCKYQRISQDKTLNAR